MSGRFSKARPSKRKKVFCAGTHLLQQSESTVSSHINSSSDDVSDLPNEPCTSEAAKVPDAVMDPDPVMIADTVMVPDPVKIPDPVMVPDSDLISPSVSSADSLTTSSGVFTVSNAGSSHNSIPDLSKSKSKRPSVYMTKQRKLLKKKQKTQLIKIKFDAALKDCETGTFKGKNRFGPLPDSFKRCEFFFQPKED